VSLSKSHRSNVRAVLFDLDDTLFDHRASAAEALRRVHVAHECFRRAAFDDFERQHAMLLEEFHPEVVSGRLDMDDARRERFRRLFACFGVAAHDALCAEAAGQYRREYVDARRAIAGAAALLEAVRPRAAIAIVSNNMLQEQREKLEYCGLAAHVDALIVSEEAGCSKPEPAIFRLALDALSVPAGEAIMVGDSWSADVVGALAAGIRPIWFNPRGLPSPEPHLGVAELRSFEPVGAALASLNLL
jgi:HAD superfamily hydrolase (TIGR01549 family)